ncbi:bifunctional 4-hydroxy-2-oxoglutarate aldolase/2-dehydro-3-deoxy-phosphogluconate aldolase [Albibacterium indicum]|uniref:bifunctional 4-hydroxy-2-oxoglutarate aldolase/2-dehydro-3-deoxy-phosphogluconate aldolase n=1 Tax=Albibacterium indicum TaxID=2292082 RepID=UPI000E542C2D|nr:bifunctional 4-hydroxy-2-oxoglutarate aldolase/2-dehydro-3-deoxy-phosphogluconate aldolase [Pedobacter indicus]
MSKRTTVINQILEQGTLPLFFTPSEKDTIEIAQTVYSAGVKVIEYTNRGEEALRNFKSLKKEALKSMPDLQLGIGTIKTAREADNFIGAGADFIVAPTINPEVGRAAHNADLLWIPGCMTPTEISIAQGHDADIIKIFPANILGVEFLKSIKSLFAGQKFMPTGGVNLTEENIRGWFDAGVCAVGMGSQLISNDVIKEKKYDLLKERTETVLELIKTIQKK